jgi:hypothetical protein
VSTKSTRSAVSTAMTARTVLGRRGGLGGKDRGGAQGERDEQAREFFHLETPTAYLAALRGEDEWSELRVSIPDKTPGLLGVRKQLRENC